MQQYLCSAKVTPLSVLSSHLLDDPVDLSIRRASSTDETDRLYAVNTDGSMVVYSILQSQNVIAPSKFTTDGSYIAVANELATTYAIVKRTVNSADNYYLEQFDDNITVDSAKTGTAASSVTMEHLQGETVQIIRDGVVEAAQVVPASPYTITFDTAATTSYQVGQNFTVTVKTLPAEPQLAQGTVQAKKKRIIQVDAIVHETQNMSINGKLVSFRNFGESVLDSSVEEFTGTKTMHGLLGFSGTGQITISQTVPLKTMARLNQTLASTVARAAVGQDPTSGSALSLQNYALREGASEIGTSKDNAILSVENANYQADIYRRAGNAAMTSAYINAAGSLAGGVAKQNQVGWPSLSMGPSSGQFAGAPAGFAPF